jgi:hypothetical protein
MLVFTREFAMPNAATFLLPPVKRMLDRYLDGKNIVVDPFARNSKRGTVTNDLNPQTDADYHVDANEFLGKLDVQADAVLFDQPYSPRQISECYQQIGRKCGMHDTQSSFYTKIKDGLDRVLKPTGIAICFGWNSMGLGINRGYEMLEVLLVPHGGAHNDTIVTVEQKIPKTQAELFQ